MGNNGTYWTKKAGIVVSLFFLLLLSSCTTNSDVWAKVGNVELKEDEAIILMNHLGFNKDLQSDRAAFTKEWIMRQVCIQEMETENPYQLRILQAQSNWHLGDLSRYFLEQNHIQNKLKMDISDSTVIDYYNQHKEEFTLNDYIVKALYLKVPKQAPEQDKLQNYYLLKKDKDYSKVVSYAKLYADNFYYDDSTWVYFDELTKDVPTEKLNKDHLVLNRTKTYFSDEQYVYYLNVIDYKLKDATPPITFFKEEIEQILLAKKINELRSKNGSSYIQQLKQKHEITSKY